MRRGRQSLTVAMLGAAGALVAVMIIASLLPSGESQASTATTGSEESNWRWLKEGFENSSGPYLLESSNASLRFAQEQAQEGSSTLRVDCTKGCLVRLRFPLQQWLTRQAAIITFVDEASTPVLFEVRSHTASFTNEYGEGKRGHWRDDWLLINRCVDDVTFSWTTRGPATFWIDNVRIQLSTTTSNEPNSGAKPCPTPTATTCTYPAPECATWTNPYPTTHTHSFTPSASPSLSGPSHSGPVTVTVYVTESVPAPTVTLGIIAMAGIASFLRRRKK